MDCNNDGNCINNKCKCKDPFFGENCSMSCPVCKNDSKCNKITGKCDCELGWSGSDCSLKDSRLAGLCAKFSSVRRTSSKPCCKARASSAGWRCTRWPWALPSSPSKTASANARHLTRRNNMEPVFAKYTLELIALGLVTVEAQLWGAAQPESKIYESKT